MLSAESSAVEYRSFQYSEEPSGSWAEHLRAIASQGARGVTAYVLWGAHEQLQGTRDFGRTSRLRLEKFLKVAEESGLEVELKFGFPAVRESLPAWAMAPRFLQTVIPSGVWSSEHESPSLTRVPSLFDVDLQESFCDFVDEAAAVAALYLRPEGPVTRIAIDLGIYENDLGVIDTPGYVEKLQQRYPEIAPFNTNYRTTFKDFVAVTSAQGTRAIFDKRPWLAAYDYKWCRGKMLAEFAEKLVQVPSLVPLRDLLYFRKPNSDSVDSETSWELAIDPVLLEPAREGCHLFTPGGLLHPQAAGAFRLWEYLAPRARANGVGVHLLPPSPVSSAVTAPMLVVISGKYLARSAYRTLDEWVQAGGTALYPIDFPQYDETMGGLDWGAPPDRSVLKLDGASFTRIRRGKGSVWFPATPLSVSQSLWSEVERMASTVAGTGGA